MKQITIQTNSYVGRDTCNPYRVSTASGWKSEEIPLTPEEEKLRKILAAKSTDSIFGLCLSKAVACKSAAVMRQLIGELKDQLRDAPCALEASIGTKAIQLLEQL